MDSGGSSSENDRRRLRIRLAVVPLAVVAAAYLIAWISSFSAPILTMDALGGLLQIEFIAVVAGAFLVLPAAMAVSSEDPRAFLQWAIFLLLLGLFARATWQSYGFGATLAFVGLVVVTYGPGLAGWRGREQRLGWSAAIFLRWLLYLIALVVVIEVFDLPTSVDWWVSRPEVAPAGFFYFLAISLVELSGVFEWLEDKIGDL